MSSNIKVFKLTYSGKFIESSGANQLDYFNLFDIIAVYINNQKRMYVWVAKKASQSLRNHIPQIRRIFSREYPELVILRNVTVDAGSEPPEFFELMDFNQEELVQHLRNIETNLLPIISEINRLKNDVDKYFIAEDYEKAIFQSKKIIDLAQKIKDESLERDQQEFIREAEIKEKAKKKLKEIEKECKVLIEKFEKSIEAEDYRGAHNVVGDFKLKYEKDYDLNSIPLAKQIILMDDNLGESINKETNRMKDQLIELYKKAELNLANENLSYVSNLFDQAQELILQINEPDITNSWQLFEERYQKKKKKVIEEIIEMTQKANKILDKKRMRDALRVYESIISRLTQVFEQ